MKGELRIAEMFYSLQGEARDVGRPTFFIRLTGCPLRCSYCDTEYAFTKGQLWSLEAIMAEVNSWKPRFVCVTGGEPLAQPLVKDLLKLLCDQGLDVSLETSGAFSVSEVDVRVSKVVDLKTPSSGEVGRNDYKNIRWLTRRDQVKFVVGDDLDYRWAKSQLEMHDLADRVGDVLFSPVHGKMNPTELAERILKDQLPVRLQVQFHKLLWGNVAGR
jgi:7-carboxy-7-deazaguanine synthase